MRSRELTAYMPFEVGSAPGTTARGKVPKALRRYPGSLPEEADRMHVKIAFYSRKGTTEGLVGMVTAATAAKANETAGETHR